jgi:hypothetical protein
MAENPPAAAPVVDDDDDSDEEVEKPKLKERVINGAKNFARLTVMPVIAGGLMVKQYFFKAAPPKPAMQVEELMRTQGFVPKHLHMIYNTFYTIGNTGEGEKLNEMDHVPRNNLSVLIKERKEWVEPLLDCLAQLGGCLPDDPDDEEEEVMVAWDDFLYMFLRFNSLTREELAQFMFMAIVKILRQERDDFGTFHYISDVHLDHFYERYRKCTIPAFSPRDVWFKDLELRRYYASDFVEVTQRFSVLLNPAVHLQRETRRDIPSTSFWDKFDQETSYNRKLTIEFFMMKKTHVFLRGEPPLRETCDLLLPTALGYDPAIHYHKPEKPKATLAAREYEANRLKALEAKKLLLAKKKHDPLKIPLELMPNSKGVRTELGRSAKEQQVKTINGRIQPPVLNKRPDVHPDTVGKALSVSLTSAKVAQKFDHHVKQLQYQLQMNQEQQLAGNPSQAALYGKKKEEDGVQPGSVPGTVPSASRAKSPQPGGYRPNQPKKLRQPPPVASVDLPRWMRDIPLKYLD